MRKGQKHSEESKRKIAEDKKGKKRDTFTRLAISLSLKKYHRKKAIEKENERIQPVFEKEYTDLG